MTSDFFVFTPQLLNIGDVEVWAASLNRQPSIDSDDAATDRVPIRSILCMPILNGKKDVIGVAQLINKVRVCDSNSWAQWLKHRLKNPGVCKVAKFTKRETADEGGVNIFLCTTCTK